MPHPAPPASPSPAPAAGRPWPRALITLPSDTRARLSPAHSRSEGAPMILHSLGKVPGRAGVWDACNAQARPRASASRVTTADCGGGAERGPTPAWPLERAGGRAGELARKHARTLRPRRPSFAATRRAVTWARHGAAGAGSRARTAHGVREPAPPRDVGGAGAAPPPPGGARWPPRRRLGKRRGPAPVGCSRLGPSRREPPGAAAAACSCAGRGTDASSWGDGCLGSA